jgi:GntR family transcriptional regulator
MILNEPRSSGRGSLFFKKHTPKLDSNCMAVTLQSKCCWFAVMTTRLHFQLDAHSGVPVYRQLMDQIKYYLASGTLAAGDQLPSIRELAQSMTINPTTVVKAYSELAHEQVIELRHGKGAFVAAGGGVLTANEQDKVIRRMARQLAVEASQMGMYRNRVLQIMGEELAEVHEQIVEPMTTVRAISARG